MLERLDHVRIAVGDPAASAVDYARMLTPEAAARELAGGDWRLEVGGVGVLLTADAGHAPGVQALVFAGSGTPPSLGDARGIRIEWIDPDELDEPATVARVPPKHSGAKHSGAERLDHVVVITTDHAAALRLYGEQLGLRLALDRSFPERGVRLLFFRIAGVTLEIGGPIEPPAGAAAEDRFGGLAWRGADVVAWRARLLSEGFAVSEHRRGHKPGTRVCTVLDRTAGVPTLLIAPD